MSDFSYGARRPVDAAGRPHIATVGYACPNCGNWSPRSRWHQHVEAALLDCPVCRSEIAALGLVAEVQWPRVES